MSRRPMGWLLSVLRSIHRRLGQAYQKIHQRSFIWEMVLLPMGYPPRFKALILNMGFDLSFSSGVYHSTKAQWNTASDRTGAGSSSAEVVRFCRPWLSRLPGYEKKQNQAIPNLMDAELDDSDSMASSMAISDAIASVVRHQHIGCSCYANEVCVGEGSRRRDRRLWQCFEVRNPFHYHIR